MKLRQQLCVAVGEVLVGGVPLEALIPGGMALFEFLLGLHLAGDGDADLVGDPVLGVLAAFFIHL